MAELKRLVSSRKGYRAHLMKLLQTLTDILNEVHPFNEDAITTLKHLYEQLERKRELISNLDTKILEGISDDSELPTEEINSSVSNAKAKITQCLPQLWLHQRGLLLTHPQQLCQFLNPQFVFLS